MNRLTPSMKRRCLGRRSGDAGPPRRSGFSLLEVLIAAALLLTVALAILPLFVRATMNTASGRSSTEMATTGKDSMETLFPAPFSDPQLVIPNGSTQTVVQEFWEPNPPPMSGGTWLPIGNEKTAWSRTVTIQQYGLGDMYDNKMIDTPLDGGTDDAYVQIKEVKIRIEGVVNTAQAGRNLTLRYYKTF
ncbi:MAG: prepilin-type N-terminal cleavage/methylation domain-containing protein [bacterium]|nr:prepilin-type N-terminal cleavage/methylation domain-containing protein [bacterium]